MRIKHPVVYIELEDAKGRPVKGMSRVFQLVVEIGDIESSTLIRTKFDFKVSTSDPSLISWINSKHY